MENAISRRSGSTHRNLKLDLRQLRHAVLAADFGSFRQAAEATLVKQSTISRSIREIEHLVGVRIFERWSGGVRPTSAGHGFLRMSRSILEQVDAVVTTTRETGRGDAGRLVIGFCISLTAGNLRATLLDFKQRFPQVELAMVERSRDRLAVELRNCILDVLIVAGDLPLVDCKAMSLWSERILVVLQENHRLALSDTSYWTDLRGQTVLLSQHDPGPELEYLLNAKLVSPSDRPQIERHNVSRGVIKNLITMGLGISLVLESDVGAKFSGLTYREVRDGTGPSRIGFSAIWRPDNANPALTAFLGLLSERYPSPS